MKKFSLFACMAALLLSAACTNEFSSSSTGEEVSVTFTAELLGEAQTRAFSEGSEAKDLYYAVFEKGKELSIETLRETDDAPKKYEDNGWSVTLNLVKGLEYEIVFWAQSPSAPYKFNHENGVVTVDYSTSTVYANDDSFDAFYGKADIDVQGPSAASVVLKRAVAQINVGTSDYNSAINQGEFKEIVSSSMTVNSVSTEFSTREGKVVANGKTSEAKFSHAALSELMIEKDGASVLGEFKVSEEQDAPSYTYLSRNYVFAGETTSIHFEVKYKDNQDNEKVISYSVSNVPVK